MWVVPFKSLQSFKADVAVHLSKIEEAIKGELSQYRDSPFYELLQYAIDAGKRIRPLILLLSAESVGNKGEDPFPAAVAIELAHIESLIHDDLIDHEASRRGKPPVHVKFGYVPALLSADFILAAILGIVSRYKDPRIAKEFASTVFRMCNGEFTEHKSANLKSLTFADYLNIIENKTASLFSASAKIGAIVGRGEEWEVEIFTSFGRFLGVSYQIKDDLSDLNKDTATFNLFHKIRDWNGLEKPKEIIRKYSMDAINCLKPLKESKAKNQLIDLAEFAFI